MSARLRLGVGLAALGAAAALAWAGHVPAAPGPPAFPLETCRTLPLRDARTGRPIVGAEDLALAPDGALWLSAHDRAAQGRGDPPGGGLYRIEAAALAGGEAAAEPLSGGPAAPHGMALDGVRLAAIERPGEPGAPLAIVVRWLDASRPTVRHEDPALCRANDLAFAGAGLLVTLDRGGCGRIGALEALGLVHRGRLVRLADAARPGPVETLAEGLAYPNGVQPGAAGLWLAETRAGRVTLRSDEGPARRVALPGGPDNLTPAPDGGAVAAVHPSLLRLALHRAGLSARAPSRVVEIDRQGRITTLLDDPGGRLLPGVTVALRTGGRLIAGSLRAPGLLVCGS